MTYIVTAANRVVETFHADVALKNVNDAPVITVVPCLVKRKLRGCEREYEFGYFRMRTAGFGTRQCSERLYESHSLSGSGWRMAVVAVLDEVAIC